MSPTPGLLWAFSKPRSAFPEAQYNTWYTDHHIHHVVDAGLSDLAIRYKNVNQEAKWLYLAIYRLPDVAKLQDEKVMGNIATTHELLPNGAAWTEAMDVDIRPFTLVQKFEGQISKEGPRGKALRTVMVEPAEGSDAEFDEWYRKQHLDMLSMVPGYRRSTRYELASESAALGNPRYLACHEYDTKDIPVDAVKLVTGMDWSKKILGAAKTFEGDLWEEIGCVGKTDEKCEFA